MEKCGNLQGFVDGRELTKNINEKKKLGVLRAYRCPVCSKCFRWEYFSNKYDINLGPVNLSTIKHMKKLNLPSTVII